jgi:predicted protein tyrosine phosphatase
MKPLTTRLNTLFVCSRNRWRSPTAERVFRNDTRLSVRSCGLSAKSPRTLRADDLLWADIVFVMEAKHRSRILGEFRNELCKTRLHVLEIADDYQYMDPELVELLTDRVEEYLQTQLSDFDADQ